MSEGDSGFNMGGTGAHLLAFPAIFEEYEVTAETECKAAV